MNTQEITIDNLAETLEYNGWSNHSKHSIRDHEYKFSNKNGVHEITWNNEGLKIYYEHYSSIGWSRQFEHQLAYTPEIIYKLIEAYPPEIIYKLIEDLDKLNGIKINAIALKPLPKKPDNLWDWCLANGWRKVNDNTLKSNDDRYRLLGHPCSYQLDRLDDMENCLILEPPNRNYLILDDKYKTLNIHIKLLNAFMEAYSE